MTENADAPRCFFFDDSEAAALTTSGCLLCKQATFIVGKEEKGEDDPAMSATVRKSFAEIRQDFEDLYKHYTKVPPSAVATNDDERRLFNRRRKSCQSSSSSSSTPPPPSGSRSAETTTSMADETFSSSSLSSSPVSSPYSPSSSSHPSSWADAPEFIPTATASKNNNNNYVKQNNHIDLQTTNGFVRDKDDYLKPYLQAADFMLDYINRQVEIQKTSSLFLSTSSPPKISVGGERVSAVSSSSGSGDSNYKAGGTSGFKRVDRWTATGGSRPRYNSERRQQHHSHRKSCAYCLRNGKNESMYDSHCLRNPLTKNLMCPELKEKLCTLCKDTGDDQVHASHECPHQAAAGSHSPSPP